MGNLKNLKTEQKSIKNKMGDYKPLADTREQIASTRREVDEVKGVMANNIEKIRERDDRLNNLQGRTADLENGAMEFESRARSLKRKYWWRNMKMWMILGVVLLVIIIIVSVSHSTSKDPEPESGKIVSPDMENLDSGASITHALSTAAYAFAAFFMIP